MSSIGQVLKLRPGQYAEYKRRHDELWPELRDVMQQNGVRMAIFHHEGLLFVHGIAPDDAAWQRIADHPVSDRWNDFMAEVLETGANGELYREILEPAFLFGEFAE